MESIYNKIDSLIKTIDSEFIKLYDCSENESKYEYFDFFTAIDQLIKLLKQYLLVKNYNDKLVEYHHALKDLFETEAKTIFYEVIDKNDQTFEITVKTSIHLIDVAGLIEEVRKISVDEPDYKRLYQNNDLKELNRNRKSFSSSLYSVLSDKCQTQTDLLSSIEQWADQKTNVDEMFNQVHLDNLFPGFYQGYFKNFIKRLKKQIKNLNINNKLEDGNLTGFSCNLPPDAVKEIFLSMTAKKQLSGNLTDFQAIFNNKKMHVENPIKWLIFSDRGMNFGRGNQTKLYFFLEKMLQRQLTNEDKRKAAKLFVDEKGEFFNPSMKKPKDEERNMYDEFENLIKGNL